jgi:valyl-tRNA synthetase
MLTAIFTLLGTIAGGIIAAWATSRQTKSEEVRLQTQIKFQKEEQKKQRLFDAKKTAYVNALSHFIKTIRDIQIEEEIDTSNFSEDELKALAKEKKGARDKDSEETRNAMSPISLFGEQELEEKARIFAQLVGKSQGLSGSQKEEHIVKLLTALADVKKEMKKELGIGQDDI